MKITIEKVNQLILWIIRILIIGLAIWAIINQNFTNVGYLALAMIMTFYEIVLEKCFKLKLDSRLQIIITLFIFAAQCLGSVLRFYDKFMWWDTMLHTISGMIGFLIGITVVQQLNEKLNGNKINNKIMILFAICFSLSIGVFWELIEFTADTFTNSNMQVSKQAEGQEAVKDTMIDLLSATIGTAIMAGVESLKKEKNRE